MTASTPSHSNGALAQNAFAFLWALAALFSLLSRWDWLWKLTYRFPSLIGIAGAVVTGCALAVILQPGCKKRFAWLSFAILAFVAIELPEVPNHRLILAFVSLAYLLAVAANRKQENPDDSTWSAFFSAARWTAILVYAFAFFSKLNADFLDPSDSCAVTFYGNIRETLGGWAPTCTTTHTTIIWATLIIEGGLVALLLWPRTRVFAVLLGIIFHAMLALDSEKLFLNFSAVMSALLILFLPGAYFQRWLSGEKRLFGRFTLTCDSLSKTAVIITILLMAWSILVGQFGEFYPAYKVALMIAWGVVAAVLIYSITVFGVFKQAEKTIGQLRLSMWPAVVVLLVILNGLTPWLGLKTRTAFNMYSNLRVEAGYSNHFLLPNGGLDLMGHLGDTVTILASSDKQLREAHVETGLKATCFSLGQAAAARGPLIEIVYERNGQRFQYFPGRSDPEPLKIPPWILRKTLLYRPIGDGVEKQCIW
ncbi:MAG: HTTM domain-containing protein [Verrucomicrobiota bacterium]